MVGAVLKAHLCLGFNHGEAQPGKAEKELQEVLHIWNHVFLYTTCSTLELVPVHHCGMCRAWQAAFWA